MKKHRPPGTSHSPDAEARFWELVDQSRVTDACWLCRVLECKPNDLLVYDRESE
jgi:hypothetical protein